jgi:23S rRNA (adenine2503-C2)-methyltransferase
LDEVEEMDLKKPSLYGLTLEELQKLIAEKSAPKYRADQTAQWIYQKHIAAYSEAVNLPEDFRAQLEKDYTLFSLELLEARESLDHESRKFLFRTGDGQLIESVLIAQKDRRTVCVSTQIGCKIGCTFCASGKGKFGRNLTAGEIVEQVAWIERKTGKPVTNIVFMGMGEPLDNFEATMKSLEILQAPWGFAIGARRITVSTSGITPKIEEFVKRSAGRVRLSVSLHSSDEAKRTELVPINKKYSLKELKETLGRIHKTLKRDITFEYTVLAGVNDSVKEAEGVARLAKPLHAKVNLIPYNPIREAEYKRPSADQVDKFRAVLEKHGIQVMVRQTAGRDIDAACGQLARLRS